jgi:hypothetical protein
MTASEDALAGDALAFIRPSYLHLSSILQLLPRLAALSQAATRPAERPRRRRARAAVRHSFAVYFWPPRPSLDTLSHFLLQRHTAAEKIPAEPLSAVGMTHTSFGLLARVGARRALGNVPPAAGRDTPRPRQCASPADLAFAVHERSHEGIQRTPTHAVGIWPRLAARAIRTERAALRSDRFARRSVGAQRACGPAAPQLPSRGVMKAAARAQAESLRCLARGQRAASPRAGAGRPLDAQVAPAPHAAPCIVSLGPRRPSLAAPVAYCRTAFRPRDLNPSVLARSSSARSHGADRARPRHDAACLVRRCSVGARRNLAIGRSEDCMSRVSVASRCTSGAPQAGAIGAEPGERARWLSARLKSRERSRSAPAWPLFLHHTHPRAAACLAIPSPRQSLPFALVQPAAERATAAPLATRPSRALAVDPPLAPRAAPRLCPRPRSRSLLCQHSTPRLHARISRKAPSRSPTPPPSPLVHQRATVPSVSTRSHCRLSRPRLPSLLRRPHRLHRVETPRRLQMRTTSSEAQRSRSVRRARHVQRRRHRRDADAALAQHLARAVIASSTQLVFPKCKSAGPDVVTEADTSQRRESPFQWPRVATVERASRV